MVQIRYFGEENGLGRTILVGLDKSMTELEYLPPSGSRQRSIAAEIGIPKEQGFPQEVHLKIYQSSFRSRGETLGPWGCPLAGSYK